MPRATRLTNPTASPWNSNDAAQSFNERFLAVASLHDDGSGQRPADLPASGLWADTSEDGATIKVYQYDGIRDVLVWESDRETGDNSLVKGIAAAGAAAQAALAALVYTHRVVAGTSGSRGAEKDGVHRYQLIAGGGSGGGSHAKGGKKGGDSTITLPAGVYVHYILRDGVVIARDVELAVATTYTATGGSGGGGASYTSNNSVGGSGGGQAGQVLEIVATLKTGMVVSYNIGAGALPSSTQGTTAEGPNAGKNGATSSYHSGEGAKDAEHGRNGILLSSTYFGGSGGAGGDNGTGYGTGGGGSGGNSASGGQIGWGGHSPGNGARGEDGGLTITASRSGGKGGDGAAIIEH